MALSLSLPYGSMRLGHLLELTTGPISDGGTVHARQARQSYRRKDNFSVVPSQYAPILSAIISTETIYFDKHLSNLVYMVAPFIVRLHTSLPRPLVTND